MTTNYVEDHANAKVAAEVDATPVEGLDREPVATDPAAVTKVVKAPAKAPAKTSTANVTTK